MDKYYIIYSTIWAKRSRRASNKSNHRYRNLRLKFKKLRNSNHFKNGCPSRSTSIRSPRLSSGSVRKPSS
jgi:hypothetical protein